MPEDSIGRWAIEEGLLLENIKRNLEYIFHRPHNIEVKRPITFYRVHNWYISAVGKVGTELSKQSALPKGAFQPDRCLVDQLLESWSGSNARSK